MSSSPNTDFEALLQQIEQAAAELRKAIGSYQTVAASDEDSLQADELNKRIAQS